MVSALCIVSPVECSEIEDNEHSGTSGVIENITDITNEDGEIIGIEYNGGLEEGKLPKLKIKIYRDGKEVILNDKLVLNVYTYNLETSEETYQQGLTQMDNDNAYLFDSSRYLKNICFKFKLKEITEEGETIHELNKSIINFTGYGNEEILTLELETKDPNAGGGNDEGIIGALLDLATILTNFFGTFFTLMAEGIAETLKTLFVPSDQALQFLIDDMYNKIIGNIPILEIPVEILRYIVDGSVNFWVIEEAGLRWGDLKFMDITIWEAGSINLVDFVYSNETLTQIHEIWYLICDGTLSLAFANYLKNKFKQIFN